MRKRYVPGGLAKMERKNSESEVLGWKHPPQAWFGILPGKDGPKINNASDLNEWQKQQKEKDK